MEHHGSITACRNHFKNMFFALDRFYVAKDIRSIFKGHRRYRSIRIKLACLWQSNNVRFGSILFVYNRFTWSGERGRLFAWRKRGLLILRPSSDTTLAEAPCQAIMSGAYLLGIRNKYTAIMYID